MSTIDRAPIADDTTAGIVAGTWAGFDPDAIVPVRVGWLAGVMERALVPVVPAQVTGYHDEIEGVAC